MSKDKLTEHQKDRRKYKDLKNLARQLRVEIDSLAEQVTDALDKLSKTLDDLEELKDKKKVLPPKEKFTDEYGHLVTRKFKKDDNGIILFQDSWTGDIGLEESTHWKDYDADEDWKNPVSS